MNDAVMTNAFSALQRAQQAQIQSLVQQRFSQAPAAPIAPNLPSFPVDTVQLGGHRADLGLMPNPRQFNETFGIDPANIPLSSDPDFLEKQGAYYDQVLQQIEMLKALEALNGLNKKDDGDDKKAEKGDLNVVAGQRRDGVKAKKVTVHEHRNWSTRQHGENVGDYNSYDSKFENAQVGKTYQVNVEWADGTTTTRNVEMDSPGQTVYIDTAY